MRSLLHNLLLRQVVLGGLALGVFVVLVVYMFGHSTPAKVQAQVTSVLMARSIDANGNPLGISQKFDTKRDTSVYALIDLQNATKKTQIAYVRYYDGRYVDSKVTVPGKDDAERVFFLFEKGVGMYPPGNYTLVTYVDGKRAMQTEYSYVAGLKTTASAAIRANAQAANTAAAASATWQRATSSLSGKVAFVLYGNMLATSTAFVSMRITNASKNVMTLKNSVQTIPLKKNTRITKNGKSLSIKNVSIGGNAFVYGVYDRKSSQFTDVSWIKLQ